KKFSLLIKWCTNGSIDTGFFFYTSNGGGDQRLIVGLQDYGGHSDTWGGTVTNIPSDTNIVTSANKKHCHVTNDTGQEGVNIWGDQRVNCVLFYCFSFLSARVHCFGWLCTAQPSKAVCLQ
ncbi:unnamed protein product, partial [Staurois parvus]